jgi:hypothetical protein
MSGVKLDFTAFFTKEAKTLISSYRRLLTQKKGVRMDPAPGNAPSVIARKGKDHWLMDTKDLYRNGFKSTASDYRLLVYASTDKHSGRSTYMGVPGGHVGQKPGVRRKRSETRTHQRRNVAKIPTYEQLFLWHNQKGYSGVFGQFPAGSTFPTRFQSELTRQMTPQIQKTLNRRITLKVKM